MIPPIEHPTKIRLLKCRAALHQAQRDLSETGNDAEAERIAIVIANLNGKYAPPKKTSTTTASPTPPGKAAKRQPPTKAPNEVH